MVFVVHNMNKGLSFEEAKAAADKKMNGSIRVLIEAVLAMYDGLSSITLDLMRERYERQNFRSTSSGQFTDAKLI